MKIEVPNTLEGIPLRNYQRLMEIENPTEEDTLSCLLDINIDVLRALKSSSVAQLSQHLKALFSRQHNLQRHFTLNGKEFGFIPNLDDASYGEIDDIEAFIVDWQISHKAMAVMFRPVTVKKKKKYLIEDYEPGKYDELMKDAPLSHVLGANVFFYRLTNDLGKAILNYMREEAAQATAKGISPSNGEDIQGYIRSLQETHYALMKPLESIFTQPLHTSPI